jgi:hypothetical protein
MMLMGGENAICQRGNINDAYVVSVSISGKPALTRYISGGGISCTILPVSVPIGTRISITGVLQDTAAVPGFATRSDIPSVNENCFNIQGYSVGLSANNASEFDPADPTNIVNAQGYGFFWYDSDSDLKPGPYEYIVVGCSGHDCPIGTTYYNTDLVPGTQPSCESLKPFRNVSNGN